MEGGAAGGLAPGAAPGGARSPRRRCSCSAARRVRRPEPWIAAALGALWIAFAVELTSYYYAFILVPALLWTEKRVVGISLLALAAFSQLVSLGPLLGLPTWRDEQYTLISLATLAVFAGILVAFNLGGTQKSGREGEPPRPPVET